jgi:AraC-like DNA-binding protein
MLLVDSAAVPERDRRDVVTAVLAQASGADVRLDPGPAMHARTDLWSLGRVGLFRNASSGMAMSRRGRRGSDGPPFVALAVQERSAARHEQFGRQQVVAPGGLMAVDLGAPFAFSWHGTGASRALQIPVADLGLPVDALRRAAGALAAGPLAGLVTRHVVDLFRAADAISADPSAPAVGEATLDLVRAFLCSAADHPTAQDVRHETLAAQVREHVRQNLANPDLSPRSIAHAHHISVRYLYQLLAREQVSLEQWVIAERLAAAARLLARPDSAPAPIAAVARRCGFRDPAHFSRRFRAAYGLSPRDWRALHTSR